MECSVAFCSLGLNFLDFVEYKSAELRFELRNFKPKHSERNSIALPPLICWISIRDSLSIQNNFDRFRSVANVFASAFERAFRDWRSSLLVGRFPFIICDFETHFLFARLRPMFILPITFYWNDYFEDILFSLAVRVLYACNGEGECARSRKKGKERALHSFMTDKLLVHITVTIFCVYELLIVR